jgi:hypothetical protein
MKSTIFFARYGNDEAVHYGPEKRLYEELTGNSYDSIEATEEQIESMMN